MFKQIMLATAAALIGLQPAMALQVDMSEIDVSQLDQSQLEAFGFNSEFDMYGQNYENFTFETDENGHLFRSNTGAAVGGAIVGGIIGGIIGGAITADSWDRRYPTPPRYGTVTCYAQSRRGYTYQATAPRARQAQNWAMQQCQNSRRSGYNRPGRGYNSCRPAGCVRSGRW